MIKNLVNFAPSPPPLPQSFNLQDSISDVSDVSDIPIISISECLRLHSGNITTNGTITSISRLYKMIKSVIYECRKCDIQEPQNYEIPVEQTKSKKCGDCKLYMKETRHEYVNAVKIEVQDSDKFSEIEKLSCILFDGYTKDIQIGSKAIIEGSIQIIKSKNKKSLPYLYSSSIEYENKQKFELSERDIKEIQEFKQHKNNS